MDLTRLKPKNLSLLVLIVLPIISLIPFSLFLGGYWLQLYSMTPFWATFGSGLIFMSYYGGLAVVMWNRKVFQIRRQRVNAVEKFT